MQPSEPTAPEAVVYDARSITVLEGLEPIRRRPGMYLGDVRSPGIVDSLVLGLVQNAVREHLLHRCGHVAVTLHTDGAATVEDDGGGIPLNQVGRSSTLERWTCQLSCGRRDGAFPRLESIGPPLVTTNAVSSHFEIETRRDGSAHRLTCHRGVPVAPVETLESTRARGVRVRFAPDPLIFADTAFRAESLARSLRSLAFLNPGLRIDLDDRRPGGRRLSLQTRGIGEWVELLGEGQRGFPVEPRACRGRSAEIEVNAALRWVWTPTTRIHAFVNQRPVPSGTHVLGLLSGIRCAFRAAALRAARDAADPRLSPTALRRGLTAVLCIDMSEPVYTDQSRSCLRNMSAFRATRTVVAESLAAVVRDGSLVA